jgi:hypothetical protein
MAVSFKATTLFGYKIGCDCGTVFVIDSKKELSLEDCRFKCEKCFKKELKSYKSKS